MDNTIINYFLDNSGSVFRGGVVVECGTAEGFHQPSFDLEAEHGWRFFGFEPDPRFFPALCMNRPNGIKINGALSSQIGKVAFTLSAHGGNSSLRHCDMHRRELEAYNKKFRDGSCFQEIVVHTMNWDFFTNKFDIKRVDLFILDVEGSELEVLKGFSVKSILPGVLKVEFSYSDPNNRHLDDKKKKNFSGFIALCDRLYQLGYSFDYVDFNDAFFSLDKFWGKKGRPKLWIGESESFHWQGYCMYEKNECKGILRDLGYSE